jgi:TonB family protein
MPSRKKILVVDFEPRRARATSAWLEERGCEVLLGGNRQELEHALLTSPPPVVLIEPVLPGLDGFELCRLLKTGAYGPAPAVICASRMLRGDRARSAAKRTGADLFLERPAEDVELMPAIERLHAATVGSRSGSVARHGTAPRARKSSAHSPLPVKGRRSGAQPEWDPDESAAIVTGALEKVRSPGSASRSQASPVKAGSESSEDDLDRMVEDAFSDLTGPDAVRDSFEAPSPNSESAAPASAEPEPGPASVAVADAPPSEWDALLEDALAFEDTLTGESSGTVPVAEDVDPTGSSGRVPNTGPVTAAPRPRAPGRSDSPAVGAGIPLARDPSPTNDAAPPPKAQRATTGAKKPTGLRASPGRARDGDPAVRLPPWLLVVVAAVVAVGVFMTVFYGPLGRPDSPRRSGLEPARIPQDALQEPSAVPPGERPSPGRVEPSRLAPQPDADRLSEVPLASVVPEAGDEPAPGPRQGPLTLPDPIPDPLPRPREPALAPPESSEPASSMPDAADTPAGAADVREPDISPIPEGSPGLTPPRIIEESRVRPVYPHVARTLGLPGRVTMLVTIGPDGRVVEAEVLDESAEDLGFGEAAVEAVQAWRYRPGRMGDRAVEVRKRVVVSFRPGS